MFFMKHHSFELVVILDIPISNLSNFIKAPFNATDL